MPKRKTSNRISVVFRKFLSVKSLFPLALIFSTLPVAASGAPTAKAENPPRYAPEEQAQVLADGKQTLRSPEAFAQALRKKGYQPKVSYELKGIPTIAINVGGEDIGVAFSDCGPTGCNYIQLIDWYTDVTESEAYYLASRRLSEEEGISSVYWNKNNNMLAVYHFIVIGSDGITLINLIETMNYFVREKAGLINLILKRRTN